MVTIAVTKLVRVVAILPFSKVIIAAKDVLIVVNSALYASKPVFPEQPVVDMSDKAALVLAESIVVFKLVNSVTKLVIVVWALSKDVVFNRAVFTLFSPLTFEVGLDDKSRDDLNYI